MGMALAAIANDHDLFGLDQVYVGITIIIDAHLAGLLLDFTGFGWING